MFLQRNEMHAVYFEGVLGSYHQKLPGDRFISYQKEIPYENLLIFFHWEKTASFSYIAKIPGCRRLEQSGKFWNISEHNFCNFWGEVGMVVDHPWSHLEDRTHFYLLDMIENDSWSFPIIWNFYNKCEHHAGLLRCDRRLSLIIINFNVVISNLRSRWTITITDLWDLLN